MPEVRDGEAVSGCTCERCADCHGSGLMWRAFRSTELRLHRTDDLDDPETCPCCNGEGTEEKCESCSETEGSYDQRDDRR